MTLLQNFLRTGGTIQELADKYAIKTSRHAKYANLVLFKYNQIESPFSEAIVRECRGIILDELNNWEIVSRPFDKFFNHGEGHAAPIDWSTAKVQEKVDGSLATLYHYDGRWHIATSGTPDAGGLVNDFGFSFAELFWKTFDAVASTHELDSDLCYIFELTSQYNKVVVRHSKPGLTLLGARNVKTQQELSAQEASGFFLNVPVVKSYSLSSFDEIVATFPSIDPMSQEGYVVVDAAFNRVKVKSPAYVALHHMKDSLGSQKALVIVALNGEIDEVVAHFPEYAENLQMAKLKIDSLVSELEAAYEKIKDIPVQKDFALEATKTKCSSALFSMRSGKATDFRSYLRDMNIQSVLTLLGYKDTPDAHQYYDTGTYSTK